MTEVLEHTFTVTGTYKIGMLAHLEDEAKTIHSKIVKHEKQDLEIATQLSELDHLHDVATASIPELESSFEKWFCTLTSTPRGSFWRYWNIGIAIKRGLQNTPVSSLSDTTRAPTGNELANAGRALSNGATVEETQTALERGNIKNFATAASNGGTIKLTITLAGADEMNAAVEKFKRVYARLTNGEILETPEAIEWVARCVAGAVSEDEIETWLKGQGVTT